LDSDWFPSNIFDISRSKQEIHGIFSKIIEVMIEMFSIQ
jgi:hypothetical protein